MNQTSDQAATIVAKQHARSTYAETTQGLVSTRSNLATDKCSPSLAPKIVEAPRHVVRRDPVVQAEPPPPPQNSNSASFQKSVNRRKREVPGNNGDGGGSDSDDESRRHQIGVDNSGLSPRRQTKPIGDSTTSTSKPRTTYKDGSTADEVDRMETLRNLRAVESKWRDVKSKRQENQSTRKTREQHLVASLDSSVVDAARIHRRQLTLSPQSSEQDSCETMLTDISRSTEATENYLYRAILWRSSEHQEQEAKELLETAITMFEGSLLRCVIDQRFLSGYVRTDLRHTSYMLIKLRRPCEELNRKQTEEGKTLKSEARFSSLFCHQPGDFDREYARYIIHLYQDPKFYDNGVFGEEAEAAKQLVSFKKGTLWHELQICVDDGHRTDKYRNLMEELFPIKLAELRQVAIRESIRGDRVVREAALNDNAFQKIIKGDIAHDFLCEGGQVSAILFKYQRPFSIVSVATADSYAMGWVKEHALGSSYSEGGMQYWKYECGKFENKFIFKISMDGEVRGMWLPQGDISWDASLTTLREEEGSTFSRLEDAMRSTRMQ